MKHIKRLVLSFATFALLLMGVQPVVAQQTSSIGNGLKISPVRNDLTIEKGKSQTVSLFLENVTPNKTTVRSIINDFVAGDDETGQPRVILDEDKSAPGNSFKSLVPDRPPNITLEPKERKEVKLTVVIPGNAASGGYYGAARFAPTTEQSQNVSLTASVGSLFLVRVPGDVTEQLSIVGMDAARVVGGKENNLQNGKVFTSATYKNDKGETRPAIHVAARFKNDGNIHVQPFGRVTVKDMRGKVVEAFEINNTQPRGNVLPSSTRRFSSPLSKIGGFGRYTIEGNFGYGENGRLISAKTTFYVIPYALIAVLLVLILFAVFVLPPMIRAYNKRIVEDARRKKA